MTDDADDVPVSVLIPSPFAFVNADGAVNPVPPAVYPTDVPWRSNQNVASIDVTVVATVGIAWVFDAVLTFNVERACGATGDVFNRTLRNTIIDAALR